ENVPDGATFVSGSVVDAELVDELFRIHEFSHVFHLAAYAAEGLSHFIRRFNYTNNVLGSINVLNAAVRAQTVERFVFASSIAVYGPAQTPMSEDVVPEPEDPYGIGKYAVELDLAAAQRMFGLDYTVFRPHNVYGELQNLADPYRNVIGIFMNQVMSDRPMTVFGEQPTVPLEEGLRRMARWALEAGVREPIRFESVEVLRNMPPSWAEGLTQTA